MTNGKMNFADLKLLEKDLHRELTDNEAMLGYTKGWRALLEYIGMTDEKYVAYRRLIELLVAYCTKDKVEFAKLRQAKDYTDAFALLSDFVADCCIDDVPEEKGFDMEDTLEDENESLDIDEVLEYFVNNIPEAEKFWLIEYAKFDNTLPELKKYVTDLFNDDEDHIVEEEIGNMLDVVKDVVVEKTAARLAKTGEAEKLPTVLLSEVYDYIEKNWTNYSLQLVNGVIRVKKY